LAPPRAIISCDRGRYVAEKEWAHAGRRVVGLGL
jgi:hypothetical protein